MKKNIFTLMALMAALCACNKEQFNESEVTEPIVEPSAPLVFTATMEDAPSTKATFDNTAKCASWEIGDAINLNGFQYKANAAGTSSTFSMVGNGMAREIRPTFVSTTDLGYRTESETAASLVDEKGVDTRWAASTEHRFGGVWNIVVTTGVATRLHSIKLWNYNNGTYPVRSWKAMKVFGSHSATDGWVELKSFDNLNLAKNNRGFAGEIKIESTQDYTFYRIDVSEIGGGEWMEMSDMKFVVCNDLRPAFVSTTTPGHYGSLDASKLVDDSGPTLEWCTPTSAKVDGVWNIVVSTGSPTLLNTIKLWNARNTVDNPGRTWKDVELYGKLSSTDAWRHIKSFDDLKLDINNYGFAGDLEINSSKPYTFYKIDILENKGGTGDNYMQMADMKFTVNPAAPYYAYFPASLFDGFKASLPSTVSETWTEGKFNMPMYAQSNTTDLEFKNLCGVLKVIVKKEIIASVKSIRVSSSNKAISGDFTVSGNTAVLTSPNETTNTLTVTYTNAVSTTDEGTAFYLAIPAQAYRNLKIEVSSDGTNYTKSMTTKKDVDIVVERNKIYPITINPPTTGTAIANINGKKVYVPWVQLWDNGSKWAPYNVGVTDNKPQSYGNLYKQSNPYAFADKATAEWGNDWKTPSIDDFKGLIGKCTSKCDTIGGVKGITFTGKGIFSKNSIFLPFAGDESTGWSSHDNTEGVYASSSPQTNRDLRTYYFMKIKSNFSSTSFMGYYEDKASIRAVVAE